MTPVQKIRRPAPRARELRELRPHDRLHLSQDAMALSLRRLKSILRSADPADRPLKHLLNSMVTEEESIAEKCRRLDRAVPSEPDVPKLQSILREFFPSASATLGEGRLHREAALYFAEMLAGEQAAFFEAVAGAVDSPEARAAFASAHEASVRRMEHLRSVIL
ncbi:MAG TPA: hypothetical protein VEJ18_20810 [Planctomycetota bacterium]|nr:hypothetical protein [Planctomycetota bacterium]